MIGTNRRTHYATACTPFHFTGALGRTTVIAVLAARAAAVDRRVCGKAVTQLLAAVGHRRRLGGLQYLLGCCRKGRSSGRKFRDARFKKAASFPREFSVALDTGAHSGVEQRYLPVSRIVIAAGLTIQVAGVLLAVWARRHLGRYWSGEIAIKLDHALVRSGPYGLVATQSIRHC